MKVLSQIITAVIIVLAIYLSFSALMPSEEYPAKIPRTAFSTNRAFEYVKAISEKPHYVGSEAHENVVTYLEEELKLMGLSPKIQKGYTAGDWANLSRATNIMARIKGSGNGKALLLLSHYDSHPHSSYGASDAASGVATILEGVSAYLAKGKTPKNDIIILFTDAEELGLNGAQLFVNENKWVKDVGLVLNFEARGSGGPSYLLIETNAGNAGLVHEFKEANPEFPVGNSFMYSIYKLLPNDTDLTVFREDANINGFNFAFIDDHYDYHSQLDTYDRLDKETLAHQGSYLMPLVAYFANADLTKVVSDDDAVYFNMPLLKFVSYPFSFIIPMLVVGAVLFVLVLLHGKRTRKLAYRKVLLGLVPFLLVLLINGVLGYFMWPVLKGMYPGYNDMLHGFTYNGHWYILAATLFSLGSCFLVYRAFRKLGSVHLFVAPIFFWLLLSIALGIHLKGGAFFIIPFYFSLLMWYLKIRDRKVSVVLLALLTVPALFILAPFVQMFPVGLGLKMMIATTLFVTLIFGLMLPVFMSFQKKKWLGIVTLILGFIIVGVAHFKSGFTKETPKPSSLVYWYDADTKKSFWATYDKYMTPWVSNYVKTEKDASTYIKYNFSSKYGTELQTVSETKDRLIGQEAAVTKLRDTVYNNRRHLQVQITPSRLLNRVEVFSENINLQKVKVNGVKLGSEFLSKRTANSKLITHYMSNNDSTILEVTLPVQEVFQMTLLEEANNLLTTPAYEVPERPESEIPMPFVVNDATIIKKSYQF